MGLHALRALADRNAGDCWRGPLSTILIIDDSDAHRAEIRTALEEAGDFASILEASDGLVGLKVLLNEQIDVVLCDLELPGLDGEKLLRVKDSEGGGAPIPFLFVTASEDRDRITRLLEDGASDVVKKPFHAPDLVARLRLHLKIKQLQEELMVKNRRLEYLSSTDEVTGLKTRRYVKEVLEVEFNRAQRYGQALSILMADLDHFKNVNDGYGHPAGDAVLRGTADRLNELLRGTDVAGRYGGEEFILILAHNSVEGAEVAAERWRKAIGSKPFKLPDGTEIPVTVSIGVATYSEAIGSAEQLISAADTALYMAKENGRNRVEVFDGEPNDR
jgi:two-component system cell cycle response regulator